MHNGQVISVGSILWRVLKNPLLKNSNYEEISEYVLEFLRLLGAPLALENTTEKKEIQQHKLQLPPNLIDIKGVRYLGPDCDEKCAVAMRYATNTFHANVNEHDEGKSTFEFTYMVQKGIMITSPSEGWVEISFRQLMIDEEGYPLIPNNEKVVMALEYYILFRHLEQLWSMGKITDKVFQYYEQKKLWYMGSASSDLKISSMDHVESIMNSVNKIIINDKAHSNFNKQLGEQEVIKRFS
jgi:hypothetical protein